MAEWYCAPCGSRHSGPINEKCPVNRIERRITRQSTKTTMATGISTKDERATRADSRIETEGSDEEER